MRRDQWMTAGVLGSVTMICGALVSAQDAAPFPAPPVTPASIRSTVDASSDLVPLQAISNVLGAEAELARLGLTPATVAELRKLSNAATQASLNVHRVESDLANAGVLNSRLSTSLKQLEVSSTATFERQANELLTPAQLASIRRRRQQLVDHLDFQRSRTTSYVTPTIDQALSNDDLLSLLELPAYADKLDLTEQQLEKVDALSSAAIVAAKDFVTRLSQQKPPEPESSALNSKYANFMQQTMAVLTEQQQAAFAELNKKRHADFAANQRAIGMNPQAHLAELSKILPHGVPLPRQGFGAPPQPGQVEYRNAFTDRDARAALRLTDEQQAKIQNLLDAFAIESARDMSARTASANQQQDDSRKRLRDQVVSHNRAFQTQAKGLLTETQWQILVRERWQTLGLKALLKPEVAERLELTSAQRESIAESLTLRPLPPPTPFAFFGPNGAQLSREEISKRHDEHFKQLQENQRQLIEQAKQGERDAWNMLTPRQRAEFEKLTGFALKS